MLLFHLFVCFTFFPYSVLPSPPLTTSHPLSSFLHSILSFPAFVIPFLRLSLNFVHLLIPSFCPMFFLFLFLISSLLLSSHPFSLLRLPLLSSIYLCFLNFTTIQSSLCLSFLDPFLLYSPFLFTIYSLPLF